MSTMKIQWSAIGLLALAAACGDGALFSDAPGGGAGGAGASGVAASTGSATGGANATSVAASTSTSGGGAEGGFGGQGGVGGQGGFGGFEEPPMLECGDELCPVAAQSACCYSATSSNGALQCVTGPPANDDCNTPFEVGDNFGWQTRIECQTSEQCDGGTVCCGHREMNQQVNLYDLTRCQSSCDYPSIVLCSTLGATAGCPKLPTQNGGDVQAVCKQSTILPIGYYVCAYPG